MDVIIISIHALACILLIMLVLLQAGKGSGMGSSLGGSSQALFNTSGATGILGKATTVVAIVFMLTSLTMGYMHNRDIGSVITDNINSIETITSFSFENDEIQDNENFNSIDEEDD